MSSKSFVIGLCALAGTLLTSCGEGGNISKVDLYQSYTLVQLNHAYYAGADFLADAGGSPIKLELTDGSSITANNIPMTYEAYRQGNIGTTYLTEINSEKCTFVLKRPHITCTNTASLESLVALTPVMDDDTKVLELTQGETYDLKFRDVVFDPENPGGTVTQDPNANLNITLVRGEVSYQLETNILTPNYKITPISGSIYKIVPPGEYKMFIDVYKETKLNPGQYDGKAGGDIFLYRRTIINTVTVKLPTAE